MILGPLVVFGSVELALRLAGYGYPTGFFLRTRIRGHEFYVPNAKFTFRFFSSTQARPPLPILMAANKPTNAYRVFLFGESAANGDPDPTFGMGRYLQVLLRERFPKTDFEVLCVAITGINSHTILPIARECARHQGDLWLVYMGNNEMVGPFGAETVFGLRAPPLGLARATLAIKATRTGQLLDALRVPPEPAACNGCGISSTVPHPANPGAACRCSWKTGFDLTIPPGCERMRISGGIWRTSLRGAHEPACRSS